MDATQLALLQFLFLLLGTGALISMLIISLLALIQSAPAMAAREWLSTDGMIVKSFVTSEQDNEDTKGTRLLYVPYVAYTYFVQGTQFVATRIHFGANAKSTVREGAEKALGNYPVGAPVTVYFNPENPTDAVLVRQAPQAGRLGLLALGVFAACLVAYLAAFLLPGWVS